MNEITISQIAYQEFLRDRFIARAMMNLLEEKLKTGHGLYADEVKTVCSLLGIEVDDE